MPLRTTVFALARESGFKSDRALAKAMKVDPATICRVRKGEYAITGSFIEGARRAFPDKSLDELFVVETADQSESVA